MRDEYVGNVGPAAMEEHLQPFDVQAVMQRLDRLADETEDQDRSLEEVLNLTHGGVPLIQRVLAYLNCGEGRTIIYRKRSGMDTVAEAFVIE